MKYEAVFAAIFLLCMIATALPCAAAEKPVRVSVMPASVDVSRGDTFTVDIRVDTSGREVYAAQFTLLFDNELLNATSLTKGDLLSRDGAMTSVVVENINNSLGKIEYGETRIGCESGVSGNGTLASVSFEVIGESGRCDLKLSDVIIFSPDLREIKSSVQHGVCIVGNAPSTDVTDITVEEAYEMMHTRPQDYILLDVRTRREYEAEHINMPNVEIVNIPLNEIEKRIDEIDKAKKIIVYCKSGSRSRLASKILAENGFTVYNMLGGIDEWRIHYPITTPVTQSPLQTPSPSQTPYSQAQPTASPQVRGFEFALTALIVAISVFLKRMRGK